MHTIKLLIRTHTPRIAYIELLKNEKSLDKKIIESLNQKYFIKHDNKPPTNTRNITYKFTINIKSGYLPIE